MIERGDFVKLKDDIDLPLLARVKKQLQGRVGTVIEAWEPVNGHATFWEQCTVRFDADGRKKEVTLDLMLKWVSKVSDQGQQAYRKI
jgi:hypothetical protein